MVTKVIPIQAQVDREVEVRVASTKWAENHCIDLSLHAGITAASNLHKACVNTASTEDWNLHWGWSDCPDVELTPSCFRMALQAPAKFRNAIKKESTFSII